ncbi:RbsD/FucU family protein [Pseudomonadota bacterium]
MLKNIDPLLNPDVLYALQAMGHGDSLAIVDANFPAHSKAAKRVISLPGNTASDTLKAVLTVLPLDQFEQFPIKTMRQIDSDTPPEAALDFTYIIDKSEESNHQSEAIERQRFYELVEKCQFVISTSDLRPYACLILTKGVIFG